MNPQTYTNAGVLLHGQVQQSPTRPAASALWWAANGADSDLHRHRPAGGDRDERCAGQLTAALEALKANG